MLRRSVLRQVEAYNFGQPNLSTAFGKASAAAKSERKDHGVKVTKLSNGVRAISHNFDGAQVSVGIYAEAGAMFDPPSAPGLSYVMRWALTTSNVDNSLFQIDRTLRSVGAASEHVEIRKRLIGLRVDARADSWKAPTENFFTGVAAPRFHEPDIERFRDTFDNLTSEARWQRPRDYVIDRLETVSFYREPLGNPRFVMPDANDACTSEKLMNHYAKYVTPSRVVIAGVNVDHDDLIALYENSPFPHSDTAPHHAKTASERSAIDTVREERQYTGGEFHEQENRAKEMGTKPDMEYETIVAIGFKSFGRNGSPKEFAASLVLQQLFDIATGDSTRYCRNDQHQGVRSFYRPFSSVGLIGMTVRGDPKTITKETIDAVKTFRGLTIDHLAIAKSRAAAAFHNAELDTSRDYCDHLASSFTVDMTRLTSQEIFAAIDGVTAADVNRAKELAASAKTSAWVTGETYTFPSLRQMGL